MKTQSEVKNKKEVGIYSTEQVESANLDAQKNLPDLSQAKKHFVPLNIEYWSPEQAGEEKLVYIHSVGEHEVPDLETGEIKPLLCVMLLEKQGDKVKRFINASRVLVGNIQDAINRGEIVPKTTLTPVSITFLGAFKNRSNAFSSNRWQIIPLINTTNAEA
ncbi:MAG: hypothetical protein P1P78_10040 [Methyloprofundus sp.]|nr:hypothetical protein [Methyloprofundus sp.]